MKNLKKKMNNIKIMLKNLLPVSGKTFYRQNIAILEILKAHKEFQMFNRQDIMTLATLISKTQPQQLPSSEQIPTEPKPVNTEDVMYG